MPRSRSQVASRKEVIPFTGALFCGCPYRGSMSPIDHLDLVTREACVHESNRTIVNGEFLTGYQLQGTRKAQAEGPVYL